jgi:hypothetical protein
MSYSDGVARVTQGLRSFYTEHERDHCDFSREFPHESLFVLKAVKRVEIRWWNEVIYDLAM